REHPSKLVLVVTGSAHRSWTILLEQENSTRAHATSTIDALHKVKALAAQMRQALERGQLQRFGQLLDEGWQAKRRVSSKISTPRIDQLYALARQHGAIGG